MNAQAGQQITVTVEGAPTGLTGTIGVQITQGATITLARFTAGIVEAPAASGIYSVELTAPADVGEYLIVWDTGGGSPAYASEGLTVTTAVLNTPEGLYTTPDALREMLDLDETALPDVDALAVIRDACDAIDSILGARPVDNVTGRKVIEGEVEEWQWAKLGRAAVKAAVRLFENPGAFTDQQFQTIKGPDFETSAPTKRGAEAILGSDVIDLVSDTYLIVRSGRAV